MAPHSSTFDWKIPGMAEPGRLPSMGSHRVGLGCRCQLQARDSAPHLSRPWLLSMVFLSPRVPPSPWMTSVLCADHPSNTQLDCLVCNDLEPPHPLTKPQTRSSSQSSGLNQKFKFTLWQCSPLLLAHPALTQLFIHVYVYSVASGVSDSLRFYGL